MAIYGPYYASTHINGLDTNPSNALGAPNGTVGTYSLTPLISRTITFGGFGIAISGGDTLTGMKASLIGYATPGPVVTNQFVPQMYDAFEESWVAGATVSGAPLDWPTSLGLITYGNDYTNPYSGTIADLNDVGFFVAIQVQFGGAPQAQTIAIDSLGLTFYTNGSTDPSGGGPLFRRRRSFRGG